MGAVYRRTRACTRRCTWAALRAARRPAGEAPAVRQTCSAQSLRGLPPCLVGTLPWTATRKSRGITRAPTSRRGAPSAEVQQRARQVAAIRSDARAPAGSSIETARHALAAYADATAEAQALAAGRNGTPPGPNLSGAAGRWKQWTARTVLTAPRLVLMGRCINRLIVDVPIAPATLSSVHGPSQSALAGLARSTSQTRYGTLHSRMAPDGDCRRPGRILCSGQPMDKCGG